MDKHHRRLNDRTDQIKQPALMQHGLIINSRSNELHEVGDLNEEVKRLRVALCREARLFRGSGAWRESGCQCRRDAIVPFGARFFKNARACPRPANPHIQALYKYSAALPLPLSADSPLSFAWSIAKPTAEFARYYFAKRLRRTHHPITTDHGPLFNPPHSNHSVFALSHTLVLHFKSARQS